MNMITFPTPEVHKKGWGEELWLHNGEYCMKMLRFNAGGKSSMHWHAKKHETLVVIQGEIEIKWISPINAEVHLTRLSADSAVVIPPNWIHQFRCPSSDGAVLIEASTHHDDEDSYRCEKGDSQT